MSYKGLIHIIHGNVVLLLIDIECVNLLKEYVALK